MGAREARRARALGALAAEVEDQLPACSCWQARLGPRAHTAQPGGDLRPGAGVVGLPVKDEDLRVRG